MPLTQRKSHTKGGSEEGQRSVSKAQGSDKGWKVQCHFFNILQGRRPEEHEPGAHTHTRAPSLLSLHLLLVLDTSWDACSKHLELGYSGVGRFSGPRAESYTQLKKAL